MLVHVYHANGLHTQHLACSPQSSLCIAAVGAGTVAAALPASHKPSKQAEQELPVFCVSAKDCQRLEGRTSKDGPPSAFTKLEYTEMPQLRQHVHHVTGMLATVPSHRNAYAACGTEMPAEVYQ